MRQPIIAFVAIVLLFAFTFYAGWPGQSTPLDNPSGVLVLPAD